MMAETASQNLQMADPCYSIAIFHDQEYREEDVDVEIQKSVRGTYPDTDHVKFKTVPAVEVASATFRGSYDQNSHCERGGGRLGGGQRLDL